MAIPTTADIITRWPKFGNCPPGQVEQVLQEVIRRNHCPESTWGVDQYDGILLRVAHILTLELHQDAETAGIAAAIARGGSASPAASGESDLDRTVYGQQFKAMYESVLATGFPF